MRFGEKIICFFLVATVTFYTVSLFTTDLSQFIFTNRIIETYEDIKRSESIVRIENSNIDIRKWGCNRTETPFIFVHIGKSGGGSHRARFAASSINYNRSKWSGRDNSFYPIRNDAGDVVTKARFCNSGANNFRLSKEEVTFEGTLQCSSITPIGQAIACPGRLNRCKKTTVCESKSCPVVYVGHNLIGNEFHWLPPGYLSKWWLENWSHNGTVQDPIEQHFKSLAGAWCQSENARRPRLKKEYKELYENCSVPLAHRVDEDVTNIFGDEHVNWSDLYASLPVLRTTVLRDPFSWLVSKFFWHIQTGYNQNHNITCSDIETATARMDYRNMSMKDPGIGWVSRYSMSYIAHLCGEECLIRWKNGMIGLPELEHQSEQNLRHAFAVVGLLNETESYYSMISTRIQYIDTSLNQNVTGSMHTTGKSDAVLQCQSLYQDPTFQKKLLSASDEFAALDRLIKVGISVNRFQQEELNACNAG